MSETIDKDIGRLQEQIGRIPRQAGGVMRQAWEKHALAEEVILSCKEIKVIVDQWSDEDVTLLALDCVVAQTHREEATRKWKIVLSEEKPGQE